MIRSAAVAIVALAILNAPPSLPADEAFVNPHRVSGGSIFAEEEHPAISLDREILFVHVPPPLMTTAQEEVWRLGYGSVGEFAEFIAIFEFNRPDGSSDEIVEVAFPLEIRSADTLTGGPIGHEFYDGFLSWPAARDRPDPQRPGEQVRTIEIPAADYPSLSDIHIRQDGKEVPIDSVLIERRQTEAEAIYTVHFIHHLRFAARSATTVTVRYSQYSFFSEYEGERSYQAHYVIGTGSTWAGPIGEFGLLTVPPLDERRAGFIGSSARDGPPYYYSRENWEPDTADRFIFRWNGETPLVGMFDVPGNLFWGPEQLRESDAPTNPADPSVQNVTASSFYPGTTTALLNDTNFRTTYGPSAAFDGIPTNGWVENAPGPGLGQYLEFELLEPIVGARIYNGLRLVPPGLIPAMFQERGPTFHYSLYTSTIPGFQGFERRLSIWQRNHRVSLLGIQTVDGKEIARISLQDAWAQPAVSLFLPPGRYRAVILGVYPTREWADTAIGEISFLTNAEAMKDFLPGGSLAGLFDELVREINGNKIPAAGQ